MILGATSDMAVAIAHKYASEDFSITMAARDIARLQVIASDINIRYQVKVDWVYFDALDYGSHQDFYNNLNINPDVVICVFGLLGDQEKAQADWNECATILHSNLTGAVSILNVIANDFEMKKSGIIAGISSVAGDRGRQSNYIYGCAKAGFTAYLSGLRNRLFKSNVHVLTVKPGFVKTKMIEGLKTPGPLTASPEIVARKVYKAVRRKKNTLYVLPVWWLIMFIIRSIPEVIFKRLKL